MSTRLMNRTERLAAIEQMLFRSEIGMRVVEIATRCGVDRRTIYRDLTLLADIGVPIHQKEGRFFIDRENYTATIRLNFDEAVALFLAARVAAHHAAHPNPHTSSALHKLGNALPTPLANHVAAMAASERRYDSRHTRILETITRAWGERQKVKLWYSSGEGARPRSREFSAFCVEATATGEIYVVGFDGLTHRVRAFRLSQIRRALPMMATYQIPAQFDPRRYLISGWGFSGGDLEERTTAILQFTGSAAQAVRKREWLPPQHLEELDRDTVRLTVPLADWHDVVPWIRSWGSEVEVLEPASLRDELAREAARLMDLYEPSVRWT